MDDSADQDDFRRELELHPLLSARFSPLSFDSEAQAERLAQRRPAELQYAQPACPADQGVGSGPSRPSAWRPEAAIKTRLRPSGSPQMRTAVALSSAREWESAAIRRRVRYGRQSIPTIGRHDGSSTVTDRAWNRTADSSSTSGRPATRTHASSPPRRSEERKAVHRRSSRCTRRTPCLMAA